MTERADSRGRRLADLLLCVLFVAAILLPLIVGDESGSTHQELRKPAPRPAFAWKPAALRAFPDAFDAFLGDSFGMRARLIRWHNVVKLFGLGVSPTDELVLGSDGWLFTTRERSIDVYRGLDPFTEEDLRVWQRILEDRRDWLAERFGAQYVFAVAPNKSSVYPEKMPPGLTRVGPTRLDQLVAWMRRHSDFPLLDLRESLGVARRRAELAGEEIYYPLGTHWNRYGMLAGYWRMMEEVQQRFPQVVPHGLDDFRIQLSTHPGDNWGKRLYVEDLLHQTNVELIPLFERRARVELRDFVRLVPTEVRVVDDPSLPSAVMLHDSFGNMQKDLVADHFRRTLFHYAPDFDVEVLEDERPEVVLHVLVERALAAHRPAVSPLDDDARLEAEFASSADVLVDLLGTSRPEQSADALSPELGAQVERGVDGRGPYAAVRSPTGGAIRLPGFEVPPDTWAVVRLEIESALPTTLALEFQTREEPFYSQRSRRLKRRLRKGVNVLWWKLLVPDLSGRLRVEFLSGAYRIHAFEARAVPR